MTETLLGISPETSPPPERSSPSEPKIIEIAPDSAFGRRWADNPIKSKGRNKIDRRRTQLLKNLIRGDLRIGSVKDIEEKLPQLDLDVLRKIHFLSIPTQAFLAHKGVGCIGIEEFQTKKPVYPNLSDPSNPDYQVTIGPTDNILDLHFVPLGEFRKTQTLLTEAMYLGAIDLLSLIDAVRKRGNIPDIVTGDTTAVQARTAIKQFGFHSNGQGLTETPSFWNPFRKLTTEQVKEMLSSQSNNVPGGGNINTTTVHIFMKGEDFFSDTTAQKLKKTISTLQKRLAGNYGLTDLPEAEQRQEVERQSRILAINETLKDQKHQLFSGLF